MAAGPGEAPMTGTRRLALGAVLAMAGVLALAPAAPGQRGMRAGQVAPDITGGPWINSEPLTMAGLRGRVVFVEFWTYG